MNDQNLTILLIFVLAVAAPIVARAIGRWVRVPIVVFELVLGILVGPAVLGWAHEAAFVDVLSQFGLAMLFFVAGSEIEFGAFQGRTGRRAVGGWFISLVAGVAAALLLAEAIGFSAEASVVIGVALCSTALGTILPILRDEGELKTPFGKTVSAIGAVGEFGPLVAISVFLGGRQPGVATLVLMLFIAVAGLAIWWAFRVPQGALHRAVNLSLHTSGQFAIRVVFLVLALLVGLSIVLDLDMLLGAFAAGIVWRLIMRDAEPADREAVESKVEAVAFGFLVPIFFVYTGITFDLEALLSDPRLLLALPIVLVALFVIRGLPSMLAAPAGAGRRDRFAVAFFGATGLPIIVAVTSIGVDKGIIPSGAASVLVGAGMLSVLLFPLFGTLLRREPVRAQTPLEDDLA